MSPRQWRHFVASRGLEHLFACRHRSYDKDACSACSAPSAPEPVEGEAAK